MLAADADHRAVGPPHRAAGHHHLDARVAIELHGDVEIVGDDEQFFVEAQRARDLFGGGADVDEQRGAVRDQCGCRSTDGAFLLRCNEAPGLIGEILDTGCDDRAAMHAGQRTPFAQLVQILADGLDRHFEPARQVIDRHPPGHAGDVQDLGLPLRDRHRPYVVGAGPGRQAAVPWNGRLYSETALSSESESRSGRNADCNSPPGKFGPGQRPSGLQMNRRFAETQARCGRLTSPGRQPCRKPCMLPLVGTLL